MKPPLDSFSTVLFSEGVVPIYLNGEKHRILEPQYTPATGDSIVCIVYPANAYLPSQEDSIRRNPADFEGVRICALSDVLSWYNVYYENVDVKW